MTASEQSSNNIQSVDRALRLLTLISEQNGPLSLQQLCELSGLNRTTAWRLLGTLEAHGFIERNVFTKEYELGFAALRLSSGTERQYAPLIRKARPYLQELMEQSSESVLLSVPRFSGTVAIDQVDSPQSVCLKNYINIVTPLHCSSTGKVILSLLSEQELSDYLRRPLEAFTSRTITDPMLLRRQLTAAAHEGYATVVEELADGENGISVPILYRERPLAILSIGGPAFRLTAERMRELAPLLIAAGRRISALLA